MNKMGIYNTIIKRVLDIVLSTIAFVALSPVLLITAILVRIKLGSPIIFKQPRPGKNEKIFYLYKFRSMTNEVGVDGRLLPDAQRLTKFGKFLRASSLDELMELVNIIKGDMSIVGPRPLSIYYLPHFPTKFRKRHDVRPGLTGLAQVNGRNNLPWDDRFLFDVEYVENVSFSLDIQIILKTIFKVLKHSDISVRGTTKVKDYGPYSILKEENEGGKHEGKMTYSEIGSYYWLDDYISSNIESDPTWLPSVEDSAYTFSGRNAIDIALRDITKTKKIKTVYAPSYCCVSMLQAFIDRGMKIEFYQVEYRDGSFQYYIPKANSDSVVLIMSYFGLDTRKVEGLIKDLHIKGAIIIEDITHSLLNEKAVSSESDYVVVSLRKWFSIPTGGWVGKRVGELSLKPSIDSNHAIKEKISAMHEKYSYLTGKINTKENFLLANAKFDNDLIHVDRMLRIDDTSMQILRNVDIEDVKKRRKENAAVLISELKKLDCIESVPEYDLEKITPIFVPLFMSTEKRDSLRTFLIKRGIYCPIHWPEVMGAPTGARENELSIICDQRYTIKDMQTIIDVIHEWERTQ